MPKPTAKDVAKWMLNELHKDKQIYQNQIVVDIEQKFGKEFVYENQNGNPAISNQVLREFRVLTEAKVIWERSYRCWRLLDSGEAYTGRSVLA